MKYFICLNACHVTINQYQRTMNMQTSYLTYYLKILLNDNSNKS